MQHIQDFGSCLKDYLISQVLGLPLNGGDSEERYSDAHHLGLHIVRNRLYSHQTMRIHYTTYDNRRAYDSINPRTHPDIMMLSYETLPEGQLRHPYWYARVVGIFHVDVRYTGTECDSDSVSLSTLPAISRAYDIRLYTASV